MFEQYEDSTSKIALLPVEDTHRKNSRISKNNSSNLMSYNR